jgi:hypothetical protein
MGLFSKDAQCAIWPAKARIAAACELLMAKPDLGVTCCRKNIEICRMLAFFGALRPIERFAKAPLRWLS